MTINFKKGSTRKGQYSYSKKKKKKYFKKNLIIYYKNLLNFIMRLMKNSFKLVSYLLSKKRNNGQRKKHLNL